MTNPSWIPQLSRKEAWLFLAKRLEDWGYMDDGLCEELYNLYRFNLRIDSDTYERMKDQVCDVLNNTHPDDLGRRFHYFFPPGEEIEKRIDFCKWFAEWKD